MAGMVDFARKHDAFDPACDGTVKDDRSVSPRLRHAQHHPQDNEDCRPTGQAHWVVSPSHQKRPDQSSRQQCQDRGIGRFAIKSEPDDRADADQNWNEQYVVAEFDFEADVSFDKSPPLQEQLRKPVAKWPGSQAMPARINPDIGTIVPSQIRSRGDVARFSQIMLGKRIVHWQNNRKYRSYSYFASDYSIGRRPDSPRGAPRSARTFNRLKKLNRYNQLTLWWCDAKKMFGDAQFGFSTAWQTPVNKIAKPWRIAFLAVMQPPTQMTGGKYG